jgi:hypothetical protein
MDSRVVKWLSEIEPEFGALSDNEKTEIIDFALLWSFFESSRLGSQSAYFQERYINGDNYTYRYKYLHLERSGNPEEVELILRGKAETSKEKLIGCLGIIYRYRNNLFHGEKWDYQLQEQYANFRNSNDLLLALMRADT